MSLKVLIAVTHLLGVGHLARAAAIGRALHSAGHRVTLVSGGRPAPLVATDGLTLVQLPPVAVRGAEFRTLLDEAGAPVGADGLALRQRQLLEAFAAADPDIVVTELFPFGRRVLAAEFDALLAAVAARRPRPRLLASVRDILVAPEKPGRVAEAEARLARYDGVLVHGDPALAPLDASWPVSPALRPKLRYTGYVADERPAERAARGEAILVSGGGSPTSLPLYRAAVAAAALMPDRPWRVLVGSGVPEADVADLARAAPAHASVERARPDFPALLARAALSVSQAGYNTVVDLLRAGTPAVLVPFEGGRETEQRLRAEHLAARGRAICLTEAALSPDALRQAVQDALSRGVPDLPVRLDGAARTVALVERLAAPPAPALRPASPDWRPLQAALDRAGDRGLVVPFWWRDDDATAPSPALDRLLALAEAVGAPLALAVIPAGIEPALAGRLAAATGVSALVHGLAHANHAPPGAKKAEFGAGRPRSAGAADAAEGLARLQAALGPLALPVLTPPWNRIAPDLIPLLPAAGLTGLSAFGPRPAAEPVPGLIQVNTHCDPIAWRGDRGLADAGALIDALAGTVAAQGDGPGEPIGLLTHHRVHGEAVWTFCAALAERLAGHSAAAFADPCALFAPRGRSPAAPSFP